MPFIGHLPDRVATDTAAKWMAAMLRKHGLNVKLRSDWVAQNTVNSTIMNRPDF